MLNNKTEILVIMQATILSQTSNQWNKSIYLDPIEKNPKNWEDQENMTLSYKTISPVEMNTDRNYPDESQDTEFKRTIISMIK